MYESHPSVLQSLRDHWVISQALPPALSRSKNAMVMTPTAGFHDARTITHPIKEEHWIGLEISAGKLYQLLVDGAMSVTDFRCLDHVSKCRVRTLCLHACAHRLNEGGAGTAQRRAMERPS